MAMTVFKGIQSIYAHVRTLFAMVVSMFESVDTNALSNFFPPQFAAVVQGLFVLVISLAVIGVIKKLSFLTG